MITASSTSLQEYLGKKYPEFNETVASDRLKDLYADFSNPLDFKKSTTDNYKYFWRTIILDCNLGGYLGTSHYYLVFDVNSLAESFYRSDVGKPLALEYVMSYLKKMEDILPIDEYIDNFTTSTWLSRMYDTIIKTPVRWSLSTIVNSTTTTTSSSLYVCIPSIQVISETILQRYRKEKSYLSWINKILTFNEFCSKYEKYNSITLTEGDIWLLLKYMNSHFGVTLDPEVQGYGKTHLAIKFPKYNEHDLKFHSTPEDITDNDKAVISLKSTCEALHDQVKDLELKMEELVKQCLVHSTKKQKTQALYLLKRKKQLEQILDRRLKSLDTIETILLKIDSSHNDLQVMQAFNVGADTLKHILSNNNITVTSVDETIQKIQDALEDQKRIEDAITSGMKQATYSYDNDGHDEIENETSKTILKEKRHWDQVDEDDDKNIDVIKPVETTYPLRSDSELARLHTILSELPEIPIRPPPKSKQRRQQRQQQLA